MAALMEDAAGELRSLIAKATAEDLSDGGRYFAETYDDLTRCRHEEIGEYQHATDGELIEWLWNRRSEIADLYAAHSEPRPVADREKIARIVIGPRNPVPRESTRTLRELQDIRWSRATNQERSEALWIADSILATHSPAPTEVGEVERLRAALVGLCSAYVALDIEGHRHAAGSWYQHARAALSSTQGGAEA